MKKNKSKRRFLWSMVGTATIALLGLNANLKLVHYTFETSKVSEPIKLALLTDLHSCDYGDEQNELIQEVVQANPDVVLLGGDIFDDRLDNINTLVTLKALSERYPCYYVSGNHEVWSGELEDMLEILESLNIKVLSGTYDVLTVGDDKINICGVDDPSIENLSYRRDTTYDQLKSLKGVHENGYYTVLLAHRPELIDTYAHYGYDLILSGHAHGGQWRLPGVVNGLYAPNQGIFPEFAGGHYTYMKSDFVVSRGLARESTRIPRFFNRPELVLVTIQ